MPRMNPVDFDGQEVGPPRMEGWRWDPDCGWICLRCSRPINPAEGSEGCCCPEPLSLEQRRIIMDALTSKGGTDR